MTAENCPVRQFWLTSVTGGLSPSITTSTPTALPAGGTVDTVTGTGLATLGPCKSSYTSTGPVLQAGFFLGTHKLCP